MNKWMVEPHANPAYSYIITSRNQIIAIKLPTKGAKDIAIAHNKEIAIA